MADASKTRPADHKIPGAVRDVFSTNRMQSAWRMAQGSTEEMRMPAVNAIFRMLEKEGLTFEDVMTAVLTVKPSVPDFGKTMEEAFGGFGDIFSASPFARQAEPAPQPKPAAQKRRTRFSGAEIPHNIHGTVSIDEERPTKNGRMLVFSIHNMDEVFGPIVCFTTTGIGVLKAAAEEDATVVMKVRPPNGVGLNPTAIGVVRV